METEVAIVGAGPAGLSAAVAASEAGCRVTIVDAYARPGGQYYKQMPGEFHPRRPETLYHDFSQAQQLFAKLDDHARVQVLSGTTVWTVQAASTPGDPVTLYLNTGAGSVGLRAEKVILAPGAYDRVLPFPGWDRCHDDGSGPDARKKPACAARPARGPLRFWTIPLACGRRPGTGRRAGRGGV